MAPVATDQQAMKSPMETWANSRHEPFHGFLVNAQTKDGVRKSVVEAVNAYDGEYREGGMYPLGALEYETSNVSPSQTDSAPLRTHSVQAFAADRVLPVALLQRFEKREVDLESVADSNCSTLGTSTSSEESSGVPRAEDDGASDGGESDEIQHLSQTLNRVLRPGVTTRSPANGTTTARNTLVSNKAGTPQNKAEKTNGKGKRLLQGSGKGSGEEDNGDDEERGDRPSTPKRIKRRPFACPFYQRSKSASLARVCKTGFKDINRVKTHVVTHHVRNALEPEHQALSQDDALGPVMRSLPFVPVITNDQKLRINEISKKRSKAAQLSSVEKWNEMFGILFPGERPPSPYFEGSDTLSHEDYARSVEQVPPPDTRAQFVETVSSGIMTRIHYESNILESGDRILRVVQGCVQDALDIMDVDLVRQRRSEATGTSMVSASTGASSIGHQQNDVVLPLDGNQTTVVDGSANTSDDVSQSHWLDATWATIPPIIDSEASDVDRVDDDKVDGSEVDSQVSHGVTFDSHASASGALNGVISYCDASDKLQFTGKKFIDTLRSSPEDK